MASIAVVDDIAVNRELLATVLRALGHVVVEAADGAEALVVVRRMRPAMVICDILMPDVDGYEFVRRLRQDADIAGTPVVFYTAYYLEPEARQLAHACGVTEILTKPCDPEQIVEVVSRVLSQAEAGGQAAGALSAQDEFDRRHLHLMSSKLSEKVAELQAANQKLAALIELNLQLASRQMPHLLEQVCSGACVLIGAACGTVAVSEGEGEGPVHVSHCGLQEADVAALGPIRLDAGLLGEVMRGRRPLRLSLAECASADLGLPAAHLLPRAVVAAPILSPNRSHGWICLLGEPGRLEFGADDERILSILAAQAGRIYEDGSLYERVERHAQALEREIAVRERAQHQLMRLSRMHAVLSGINSAIVRIHDRASLFHEACRIAVQAGRFGIAWIGEVDARSHGVTPRVWATEGVERGGLQVLEGGDLGVGMEAAVEAVRRRRPVPLNDLSTAGENDDEVRVYPSLIALPLLVEDKVAAVIVLYASEADFFNGEELDLLAEMADDISFGLDYIRKQDQLAYLAHHDALTGLANRAQLFERLALALHAARQHPGRKVGMVVFNINRFRNINDTFGRKTGDALLRELAQRLLAVWPEAPNVARIAIDHFGAILTEVREPTDIAHLLVNPAMDALRRPFKVGGRELRLSLSAGVAVFPGDGEDADSLVRNAEAALRKAKKAGERYLFYGPEMNARVADTLTLENKLRWALERDEFMLYYQPKVDGASGRMTGLEALIRWNDPETGLVVLPAGFIPLLEETGMMPAVGDWVMRRALSDARKWREEGVDPPPVAVNVSACQLQQKNFVDLVKSALDDSGINPPSVELEITESMLIPDIERNIVRLSAIRALGVDIAIDDFGTGYSSLGYLSRLPVSELKIDRSFIETMTSSPESMSIVSAIISLAHSLDLGVIAEGVELEEQAKFLRLLKCNNLQGYLISPPIPAGDVSAFIRQARSHRSSAFT
ncbi:MAG: EAL domain-containing protein [Zoogloea sp.]|nr:EAL domain-containing protein [Zoogloea sp.]